MLPAVLVLAAVVALVGGTVWAVRGAGPDFVWGRSFLSDLGNTSCLVADGRWICSPRHDAFNDAFVAAGLLLCGGAFLGGLRGDRGLWASVLAAGAGLVLLGSFPPDVAGAAHLAGAVSALPLAGALLLVSGVRESTVVAGARRRWRLALGAAVLLPCLVHLGGPRSLRSPAELASIAALLVAHLGEAGRLAAVLRRRGGERRARRRPSPR